jgi:autotransporter-associated beta strand protein
VTVNPSPTGAVISGAVVLRNHFNDTVFNVAAGGSGSDLTLNSPLVWNGGATSFTSMIKAGNGIMTLAASNNTGLGTMTVSNGTLAVNGSVASGTAVTVAPNGALSGFGTVAGPVSVYGTLAPGANAVGTLTTGPAYLYGGSTLTFKVASADTNNAAGRDFVNMNGTLYLDWLTNGNATIKLVSMQNSNTPGNVPDFNPASNYSWTVGTATSLSVGNNLLAMARLHLDTSAFSNTHGGSFALAVDTNTYSLKVNYTAGSSVNTTPAPLVFTVTGNNLHLSWPADHQGWHLQYQTNSLSSGLGTNWTTVPGSDAMTSTNITVDPTKPTVFYRLVYP